MFGDLEHMAYQERLRELNLFSTSRKG